tara:strand:+ start:469 stop:672 length:204 start_codon:yes stop_codon:yes gene_type:complete
MKVLKQLKLLKSSLNELKKLNEDLIEKNSANKVKINLLEEKIAILQKGIKESIADIENIAKSKNANS